MPLGGGEINIRLRNDYEHPPTKILKKLVEMENNWYKRQANESEQRRRHGSSSSACVFFVCVCFLFLFFC
jgi:hypothetical protein